MANRIVRLTESDLNRIVRRVIIEQDKNIVNEGFWDNAWSIIKQAVVGPLPSIYKYFTTDTTKQTLKVLLDFTPVGILKNMAIAASNGDANSFTQALQQSQKYTRRDLTDLKNIAFKDLKGFGNLLKSSGIK
jgi:hypothetical protein